MMLYLLSGVEFSCIRGEIDANKCLLSMVLFVAVKVSNLTGFNFSAGFLLYWL